MSYRNPAPTVDIIIELDGGVVLIERKNHREILEDYFRRRY